MSIDQIPGDTPKKRNTMPFDTDTGLKGNQQSLDSSMVFENSALIHQADLSENYSNLKMKLNLKVQLITNAESYMQAFID